MAGSCPHCQRDVSGDRGVHPENGDRSYGAPDTEPFLSLAPSGTNPWVYFEPDTRIDRFVIRRELGRGSSGTVYLAHDTVRSEDVAIKVVRVGPCSCETAALQLRRELAARNKIKDFTHVLRLHDIFPATWGGMELLLLSMEYADGGTFREWLLEHHDDWQTRREQGLEYFKQACLGVAAIHAVGEAHRDIKPENLLLVNGVLKVADFGASTCVYHLTIGTAADADCDIPDRGTPAYMSREQFNAAHPDDPDGRCDIYALGVILFELLHPQGRTPFGGSYARLRELHTNAPVPYLPEATEVQTHVIGRCLEKDPARRYQCIEELLAELESPSIPPPTGPEAATEISQPADEMWQAACQHAEEGRFNEALRLTRRVLGGQPEHTEAQALLEELQHRFDQVGRLYAAMEQGLHDMGLEEQIPLLSEAIEGFPEHPAGRMIQVRLEVKARQYRQAMEDGLNAAQRGGWESAQPSFERARELNPGASEVERPARFVADILTQVQEARDQIDHAIAAGDWSRALSLARGVDMYTEETTHMIRSMRFEERP